jgi:hypothetical protein
MGGTGIEPATHSLRGTEFRVTYFSHLKLKVNRVLTGNDLLRPVRRESGSVIDLKEPEDETARLQRVT